MFKGLKVFVTGHTGFKGSWLCIWLHELGADVYGYSLPPPTQPSNYELSEVKNLLSSEKIGNILDYGSLINSINEFEPDLIFHLAAQALVLPSYDDPRLTFQTNILGTINVLEAARWCKSVKAIICVTSDKCYKNKEWVWGYRENDELGGNDPYSASKAATEIVIESYRKSFFNSKNIPVASVRAGNVIGGGDWAKYRLVPDIMMSLLKKEPIVVRNPSAMRPYQFILEPLSGYLYLAYMMLHNDDPLSFSSGWNFGPFEHGIKNIDLVKEAINIWGTGTISLTDVSSYPVEIYSLALNWDKAREELKWMPTYTWKDALQKTIDWYNIFTAFPSITQSKCIFQINEYIQSAKNQDIRWAKEGVLDINA